MMRLKWMNHLPEFRGQEKSKGHICIRIWIWLERRAVHFFYWEGQRIHIATFSSGFRSEFLSEVSPSFLGTWQLSLLINGSAWPLRSPFLSFPGNYLRDHSLASFLFSYPIFPPPFFFWSPHSLSISII